MIETFLPRVQRNVSLKNYTTFGIGGPARYFFIARTKDDIVQAFKAARKYTIPFLNLGEGSNLLISDNGFDGLVVKMENTTYAIHNTRISAESGILFSILVRETGKRGLSGLEWAGGLPGTLGGAVRGNAGAFGGEIKDSILSVEALDRRGIVRTLSKRKCHFVYRSSVFKKKNWIVLSAILQLKKGNKKVIQSIARDHSKYRKEKHPLEFGNAGSIFKNCDLKTIPKKIRNSFSAVIKTDPFPVVPTAYLIAKAGLKGLQVGQVQVSKKHPNYIVNLGGGTARDVVTLIRQVKKAVKKTFGIAIEEEIQCVGFSTLDILSRNEKMK